MPLLQLFPTVNVLPEQDSSSLAPTVSEAAASLMLALAMLVSALILRRPSVTILSALLEPASSSLAQTASAVAARMTPAVRSSPSALPQSPSVMIPSAPQALDSSNPAPTVSAAAARVMLVVRRSPSAPLLLPSDLTILSALLEPASSSLAQTASVAAARATPAVTRGAPSTRSVPTSPPRPSQSRLAPTEHVPPTLASSRSAPTVSRDAARRTLVARRSLSAPSKRWNEHTPHNTNTFIELSFVNDERCISIT